tara:strand:+ start:39055 stop:40743 length:1689 start_codon:yes stop_codon:yes gene_type:complete
LNIKHVQALALIILTVALSNSLHAQDAGNGVQKFMAEPLEIHGNFSARGQYYQEDSAIGAPDVPEQFLMNGFANVIVTKGAFSAGVRYESYRNPILGFDQRYKGSGFPYRYVQFSQHGLDVTAGNFYEQFGTGLLLRSYEERDLGVDNAFDGIRVKYSTKFGVYLKGLIGKQRYFFDLGPGIVRGVDGLVNLNEAFGALKSSKFKVKIGGSFVSKYQEDNNPNYKLPENVASYSGRLNLSYKGFGFLGEYAYKMNDPSADNEYIYKDGAAMYLSGTYSRKGLGIVLSAKSIDNMSYRSDREEGLNNLLINFNPALTKQHTYNLAATLYPYASQLTGEVAYQGDIVYKIKRKTPLGGKYGTTIFINVSKAFGLDSTHLNDENAARQGYEANFFKPGQQEYYQDINISLERKIVKWLKLKAMYMNLMANNDILRYGGINGSWSGKIYADIAVLDMTFKLKPKHSIRAEIQGLWSQQDMGDWATFIVEYTFSPNWFVAVMDQFNYGNPVHVNRIHYPYATFGYTHKANRISIGYGRQKAGLFCVGGVCRVVPASNGLTISVTSSF